MAEEPEILVRVAGRLGRITLNRPRALNALHAGMVDAIAAALDAFEADPRIASVLLDGAGERAFCAGGDIRALHRAVTGGRHDEAVSFMRREYRLNARLARFPKPVVGFAHGVVMGGGIGLTAHNRHRLVARGAVLAMPETAIGLFPDVGATHLLARAPGGLGTHVALTGARFGAAEAVALGLADRVVAPEAREPLADALAACADAAAVAAAVASCPSGEADGADGEWAFAAIGGVAATAYGADGVGAILDALDRAGPSAARVAAEIRTRSPGSLAVTLRALREAAADPDLETTLARDLRIVGPMLAAPDFAEGVRATIIDRDNAPAWSPARIEAVDPAWLESVFAGHAEDPGPPPARPF